MTILSDAEIRGRILNASLVEESDINLAKECSYSFRAGKAFPVKRTDKCIDFAADADASLVIEPGQMVWIRTRERVRMPMDLAGFWWQTNSLSRKGLMLVNMSMVEPIYRGDLACLFVNFGDQHIVIDHTTPIAKMIFIRIEGDVKNPFMQTNSFTRRHYDSKLLDLSVNQPSSFLKVGDLEDELDTKAASISNAIEERLNVALETLRKEKSVLESQIAQSLASAKAASIEEFQSDAPKMIRKSLGIAALGLLALGIAATVADQLKVQIFPGQRAIAAEEAKKALDSRMSVPAAIDSPERRALERRIEELEKRLMTKEGTDVRGT